jgi:hypothetical protein
VSSYVNAGEAAGAVMEMAMVVLPMLLPPL